MDGMHKKIKAAKQLEKENFVCFIKFYMRSARLSSGLERKKMGEGS